MPQQSCFQGNVLMQSSDLPDDSMGIQMPMFLAKTLFCTPINSLSSLPCFISVWFSSILMGRERQCKVLILNLQANREDGFLVLILSLVLPQSL